MQISYDPNADDITGSHVLAIGFFDGVHKGHQYVIKQVVEKAKEQKLSSAIVTFDPHPSFILRPDHAPKILTPLNQKLEIFESLGVDKTVVLSFDTDRANETYQDFANRTLVDLLSVTEVIVGSDFRFGNKREGNIKNLEEIGKENGFDVTPVELLPREKVSSEAVSSTAIRRALLGGEIAAANDMLTRHHEVRGTVVHGDKRGRQIGFPTANLELKDHIALPVDAVYAGWYYRDDGIKRMCAINVGKRPTFHQNAEKSTLEAHLLDFDDDLYDEEAKVQFVKLIRAEKRFSGIEEIKTQLATDVSIIRKHLETL